ncbi:MAG: type II secretion system F family protein [Candidatus Diapherotrites archaeon]|jgi:archaeal flagellar protein FlaJ|nr:type II secretion system F family protein [Candidatus Diapherotrites archaeon]
MTKTPVMMLYPLDRAKSFSTKFLFIGKALSKILFSLEFDLQKAELDIDPERFALAALFSAILYGIIFTFVGLMFGVVITKSLGGTTILISLALGVMAFLAILFFHLLTPKITANQIAKLVEQDLLFALRTLLIQISSGMSLFEAMRSISRSKYGQVSKEFGDAVKDINAGMSESAALERLAFKTKSEIFKRTIWQTITTMKSGGSVVTALQSEVAALMDQQEETIQNYAAELNLWTLIYLIIAAALPSLGVTFLVIASSIGSSGIGKGAIIIIAILAITIQAALILVIKSQVPKVIK